ncbi:MAG: glycosyltransferase family 39 protein [Candidatus Hydrogenedentes bacterium]|nr:glycosyltransferase family 39 protein [Candidatus Hydrogenedentota bacterium]
MPWCAGAMGIGLFIFHLLVNRQYGFHGDELYFIACGERPAWGYVDHPPFVPLAARFATELMGVNVFALRLFPALALGVSCILTGWLARRLGAGLFGEFLAALSFVCAPMMVRFGAFLNIPCFEVLFWLIAVHLLVTLEKRDEPRWWLAIGVLAGVSLLNKHTTLFLGTGMAVGLALTHRRKDLATAWPWLGAVISFLIFLPNLLWQYQHDWATLDFVRSINANAMQRTSRFEFLLAQFVFLNVFGAIVWIAGLVYFLTSEAGRSYRLTGWIFITVLSVMLAFKAKIYYLAPAYPMLMAGGAVLLERRLTRLRGYYARAGLSAAIGRRPVGSDVRLSLPTSPARGTSGVSRRVPGSRHGRTEAVRHLDERIRQRVKCERPGAGNGASGRH